MWSVTMMLTFLSHLDIFANSNMLSPGLLDDPSKSIILSLPHLFQKEQLQETVADCEWHTALGHH